MLGCDVHITFYASDFVHNTKNSSVRVSVKYNLPKHKCEREFELIGYAIKTDIKSKFGAKLASYCLFIYGLQSATP